MSDTRSPVYYTEKFIQLLRLVLILCGCCFLLERVFYSSEKVVLPCPTQPSIQVKTQEVYLRGVVETLDGIAIEGAEVKIDRVPGQNVKTTTDGGFSIENIPGKFGDQVRIYVKCPGYKNRDEYIFLPGPVRIRLDRSEKRK